MDFLNNLLEGGRDLVAIEYCSSKVISPPME